MAVFLQVYFSGVIFSLHSLVLWTAILVGDPIGFMAYQEWVQTDINFFYIYIVVVLVTFTSAVISGIPTILYEKKKMEKSNELDPQPITS